MKSLSATVALIVALPLSAAATSGPEPSPAVNAGSPATHGSVYSQVQPTASGFDRICVLPLEREVMRVAAGETSGTDRTAGLKEACTAR